IMNNREPLNSSLIDPVVSPLNINNNHDISAELSNINNQIIFIDSKVDDYQILIDNIINSTKIVILDSQQDGIFQITETLGQYDSLDAVHIVSHGDSGELFLGNTTLNQDTLSKYKNELNNWDSSIHEEGDILLYGCNVAADLTGAEFIEQLSEYTQADIQASDDLTGSSELGGDWYLEHKTGKIEAEAIFNGETVEVYSHSLDSFANDSFFGDDTFDRTFTIDGINSDFGGRPIFRLELNSSFDSPDIDIVQPPLLDFNPDFINTGLRLEYIPPGLEVVNSPDSSEGSSVNFIKSEDQPFLLNFGQPFNPFRGVIVENHDYSESFSNNHLLHPFDASSLNFNPYNFEFSSISTSTITTVRADESVVTTEQIKFNFDSGTFDFSSLTSDNSLKIALRPGNFDLLGIENYDNTVRINENFSFEATAVEFRPNSITFDYKPESAQFNLDSFAANANLFEDKFSASDFEQGISIDRLNASDFRALDYAFEGDEIFDLAHYKAQADLVNGINPYTDYVENGWRANLDPHPLFDTSYYLSNNTDVENAGVEPLKHYTTIGFADPNPNRDPHPLFDTSYYNENNTDVVNANKSPLSHYVESGFTENFNRRDPNRLFDSSYYNASNPDVVAE
ncbi:MAG: DUF4347 domain-containing protein, partial [Pleurocapsa sp.]